jgi:hypothetical protein
MCQDNRHRLSRRSVLRFGGGPAVAGGVASALAGGDADAASGSATLKTVIGNAGFLAAGIYGSGRRADGTKATP